MKSKHPLQSMPKWLSIGLALSLALAGITPAQAGVKSVSITQVLDQDDRLAVYGPYRLLTEQERRWLLQPTFSRL